MLYGMSRLFYKKIGLRRQPGFLRYPAHLLPRSSRPAE